MGRGGEGGDGGVEEEAGGTDGWGGRRGCGGGAEEEGRGDWGRCVGPSIIGSLRVRPEDTTDRLMHFRLATLSRACRPPSDDQEGRCLRDHLLLRRQEDPLWATPSRPGDLPTTLAIPLGLTLYIDDPRVHHIDLANCLPSQLTSSSVLLALFLPPALPAPRLSSAGSEISVSLLFVSHRSPSLALYISFTLLTALTYPISTCMFTHFVCSAPSCPFCFPLSHSIVNEMS